MKAKFTDIDLPLQQQFRKQFFYTLTLIFIAILWLMLTKDLFSFSLILLFAVVFAIFTIYRVSRCLEDAVSMFKGVCVDIYKPELKKPKRILERAYLTIQTENDLFIDVYIPQNFKCKVGNELIIYSPTDYLFSKNENTYVLSTFYYIYINRT